MMFKHKPFLEDKTASEKLRRYLNALSSATEKALGRQPYLVCLNFWPNRLKEILARFGFSAASSYGNPRGANPNGPGRGLPFSKCAEGSRYFWREAAAAGLPFLPPLALGWDFRPLLNDSENSQGRSPNGDYCLAPSREEIRRFVRDALLLAPRANPTFPSALIYAWNEYTEGGWVAPTRGIGNLRLEAISQGVKEASNLGVQ
jgi:hypothetical protein